MSLKTPTPRQAAIELIFAGALWGFGFVATQWALATWNPQGVLIWRFAIAFIVGEILFFAIRRQPASSERRRHTDLKLAIPAGVLLGTFLLIQTIGLQYTTAGKSGFITTLYVIFVPAFNFLLFKKKSSPQILVMAIMACIGTYYLMGLDHNLSGQEKINKGDLLTIGCAVLGAIHIIYIGWATQDLENPFRFNNFQSLWAGITIVPFALVNQPLQHAPMTSKSLTGILIVAIACSLFAFFIQVRTQKVLSDTTASMLFLLESPYAFFFGYLFAGDWLSLSQGAGAILIILAALGTTLIERTESTTTEPPR